jgi:hypothetical protein
VGKLHISLIFAPPPTRMGFRVVVDSTGVVGKGEEGMYRGICSFYYIIIWFHVV